jgi:hypothetical protein
MDKISLAGKTDRQIEHEVRLAVEQVLEVTIEFIHVNPFAKKVQTPVIARLTGMPRYIGLKGVKMIKSPVEVVETSVENMELSREKYQGIDRAFTILPKKKKKRPKKKKAAAAAAAAAGNVAWAPRPVRAPSFIESAPSQQTNHFQGHSASNQARQGSTACSGLLTNTLDDYGGSDSDSD